MRVSPSGNWVRGEAIVGDCAGSWHIATTRRAGARRRRGSEGLSCTKGASGSWNPQVYVQPGGLGAARFLTEEEKSSGKAAVCEGDNDTHRMQLKRSEFLTHRYTEGCPPQSRSSAWETSTELLSLGFGGRTGGTVAERAGTLGALGKRKLAEYEGNPRGCEWKWRKWPRGYRSAFISTHRLGCGWRRRSSDGGGNDQFG